LRAAIPDLTSSISPGPLNGQHVPDYRIPEGENSNELELSVKY